MSGTEAEAMSGALATIEFESGGSALELVGGVCTVDTLAGALRVYAGESVKTTLQSHAKSGAGAGARQQRVLDVLKGGRSAA
ncbi:MAG TPA: hypothetical protein VKO16_14215 [Polyangia bacterium]|nr:hypothetical protein [Polyangia bacterium]